jgi:predicted transcriptional regulator
MGISLKMFVEAIEGEILAPSINFEDQMINDGYVSDLLSDVMGSAKENQVWITIMKHLNSVAVASLVNIPCVVFAKGVKPEQDVIKKAVEENICLVSSKHSSFTICVIL